MSVFKEENMIFWLEMEKHMKKCKTFGMKEVHWVKKEKRKKVIWFETTAFEEARKRKCLMRLFVFAENVCLKVKLCEDWLETVLSFCWKLWWFQRILTFATFNKLPRTAKFVFVSKICLTFHSMINSTNCARNFVESCNISTYQLFIYREVIFFTILRCYSSNSFKQRMSLTVCKNYT